MSIGFVTGWHSSGVSGERGAAGLDVENFRVYVYLPEVVGNYPQDSDGVPMNWIHFNFTREGLVIDVVDDDGEIVETSSETYYELLDEIGFALAETERAREAVLDFINAYAEEWYEYTEIELDRANKALRGLLT